MNNFPSILRAARIANKMKQEEVAMLVGKTKNVVSNWERGDNKPDIDTLEILCRELHINPNEIINWNDDEYKHPLVIKYENLDSHGREIVDFIIEKETTRIELHGHLS